MLVDHYAAAAARSYGRIYVIGGYSRGAVTAAVEAYDPLTQHWTGVASLPTPRAWLSAAVAPDGRIYTFGGSDDQRAPGANMRLGR